MSDREWVDDLISEVAKEYKVILDQDDPVLVTAILNRSLLDKAFSDYEGLFVKNSKLLQQQFKAQALSNDKLLQDVINRLIKEVHHADKSTIDCCHDMRRIISFRSMSFVIVAFLVGLVTGITLVMFV